MADEDKTAAEDAPNDEGSKSAPPAVQAASRSKEAVYDIPVQLSTILGKTSIQVSDLLKLDRGAVVELDRKVGDPVDIYVNNQLVARGELIVLKDSLGVTMTEIIKSNLKKI